MSKHGFKTTGGNVPASFRNKTPNYTPQEVQMMTRLQAFREPGDMYSGRNPDSVLCLLCGVPVSSPGRYDKEGDKADLNTMIRDEAHFRCSIMMAQDRANKAELAEERKAAARMEAMASMTPDERRKAEASEEIIDVGPGMWDESGNRVNPNALPQVVTLPSKPAEKPAPYQFKPGELPLDKVKGAGGLQHVAPDGPVVSPADRATLEKEAELAAQREEKERQEFLRFQEEGNKSEA